MQNDAQNLSSGPLRLPRLPGRLPLPPGGPALITLAAYLALAGFALTTPGFLTAASIRSFTTTMSFAGCVAVGMTFITLSGNLMSFSLGVGLSVTTIVFVAMLDYGLWPAIAAALAFSALLNALQGWLVGYFRANPIIVSMAAAAIITGIATYLTDGRGLYILTTEAAVLKGNLGPVPGPLAALLLSTLTAQLLLGHSVIGRRILLAGSNARALLVAGCEPWKVVVWAYALAGVFTAVAAVLMAARYGSGDLQHGAGMDYAAISAVLVGGTAIQGGRGSFLRTFLGTLFIAVFQAVLVLRGFSTEWQQFAMGVLVLAVIILQRK